MAVAGLTGDTRLSAMPMMTEEAGSDCRERAPTPPREAEPASTAAAAAESTAAEAARRDSGTGEGEGQLGTTLTLLTVSAGPKYTVPEEEVAEVTRMEDMATGVPACASSQ